MTIDEQVAKVDKSKPNWKTTLAKPERMTFEEGKIRVTYAGWDEAEL